MAKKRRSTRRSGQYVPLDMDRLSGVPHTEVGPDGGDYQVQHITRGVKTYTCPACAKPIPIGTAHVVAWPENTAYGLPQGVDARRHWHTYCWNRRLKPLE